MDDSIKKKKGFLPALFEHVFGDFDGTDPFHITAFSIVGIAWVVFVGMGFMIIQDLKSPISDIIAMHVEGPTAPGGIAQIQFTYTRTGNPRVSVGDRRLLCDDGVIYSPESVRDPDGNDAWPIGIQVSAELFIRIPDDVPIDSLCWYDAEVTYPRMILPDLVIKVPPRAVKINIGH